MSDSVGAESEDFIRLSPMTIDQLAGSFVLIMGEIGTLLLVIWQSRCECEMNLCYIIRCHRKPPPDEVIKKDDVSPPLGCDPASAVEGDMDGEAVNVDPLIGAANANANDESDEENPPLLRQQQANARTPSLTPNAMN